MKFRCENVYPDTNVADLEAVQLEGQAHAAFHEAENNLRTVLKLARENGKVMRVIAYKPKRDLPLAAQKILGAKSLGYTETSIYEVGAYKGTFEFVFDSLAKRMTYTGTSSFEPREGGVLHTVEGEIGFNLAVLGGVVEKVFVAETEKAFKREGHFIREWIKQASPASGGVTKGRAVAF